MTARSTASPELVQAIENNVLLKQAMVELKTIKDVQETDHLVIVALRDHKTIERLDQLWEIFKAARWTIIASLGLTTTALGALFTTHVVWGWP